MQASKQRIARRPTKNGTNTAFDSEIGRVIGSTSSLSIWMSTNRSLSSGAARDSAIAACSVQKNNRWFRGETAGSVVPFPEHSWALRRWLPPGPGKTRMLKGENQISVNREEGIHFNGASALVLTADTIPLCVDFCYPRPREPAGETPCASENPSSRLDSANAATLDSHFPLICWAY